MESAAEVRQALRAWPHDLETLSCLIINDTNTAHMENESHMPTIPHRKPKQSRKRVTREPRRKPKNPAKNVDVGLDVSRS